MEQWLKNPMTDICIIVSKYTFTIFKFNELFDYTILTQLHRGLALILVYKN